MTSSPAAADTIYTHLEETGRTAKDYDLIVTGDLAGTGSEILTEILCQKGISLNNHLDCGNIIFDKEAQKVKSGGSGCGCVASVFCSFLTNNITEGKLKKILLVGTGALMSPSSVLVGEPITGIAHAVTIEGCI